MVKDPKVETLKPDLVCIYPVDDEQKDYCFGIYDAKYYCIDYQVKDNKAKISGQPGVGDVTKQYLYQLAFDDFIVKQGYRYVQNMFFFAQVKQQIGILAGYRWTCYIKLEIRNWKILRLLSYVHQRCMIFILKTKQLMKERDWEIYSGSWNTGSREPKILQNECWHILQNYKCQ